MSTTGADHLVALIAESHRLRDAGDLVGARARADEALALARETGDDAQLCEALLAAGACRTVGAAMVVAEGGALLGEAVGLAEAIARPDAEREGFTRLAVVHETLGELASARACSLRARDLAREAGDEEAALTLTADVAELALAMGAFEEALNELEGIEPVLSDADRRALWARSITTRAVALLHLGYVHDPLRLLDQAERTASTLGDARLERRLLAALAPAWLFLGRFDRASAACRHALSLVGAAGDPLAALSLIVLAAEAAWRLGDADAARALATDAYDRTASDGPAAVRTAACLMLARLALAAGALDEAGDWAQEGLGLAAPSGNVLLAADLQLVLGETRLAMGDVEGAEAAFDEALASADAMNAPHHRALALHGLSRGAQEPSQLQLLRTQAIENLNLFLEQLPLAARREFLALPERRALLEGPGAPAVASPAPPAEGPSFLGFLKLAVPSGAEAMHPAFTVLDEVFSLVASQLPLDELLGRINDAFLRVSLASRGLVYVFDEDGSPRLRDRRVAPDGWGVLGLDDACDGVLERVRETGRTLWVMDTLSDPDFANRAEVSAQGVRGILAIPLKVSDGVTERVIGCLYGDRATPWAGIAEREVSLLELLARHLGVTLEMRLLQEASLRKAHHLEMINSMSRALAGTLDLDHLLEQALGHILAVTHGEQGYIFFGEGEHMRCRASLDASGKAIESVQVSRSVIARVSRERAPLAILDIGQDLELQAKASLVVRNVRSVMCVPLVREEQLIGLVYISSSTTNKTFTRNDLDLMSAIASQVALALLNTQAYLTIKELNAGLEEKVKARTAELEAANRVLTDTRDQLVQTEKLATIGTLAGGVAHEINNPLGAILSNAQLLRLDISDEDHLDSLSMIEAGARRCKEIVEALLKYSRLAKNKLEDVDLRTLTEESLVLVETRLAETNVTVSTEFAPVPAIAGDAKELKQVIGNLLLNSLDAIAERHGAAGGRLNVRIDRVLRGVRLIVEDDGVGISPEVSKRIFDPFYTTKTIGSGTGLGLSVCQRIIERHGGRITVQSTFGSGASFIVELPVP